MKKFFLCLVIVFAVSFLFADKIVVDEKDAEALNRLEEVYHSLGLEFEVVPVHPKDVNYDEVFSLDEVIENLEKTDPYDLRSGCSGLTVLKVWEWEWNGSGWILVWKGKVGASMNVDDWDGSLHWLEKLNGDTSPVRKIYGPSTQWSSITGWRYAKARGFLEGWVWVSGIGWVKMIVQLGPILCYDLNNL